MKERLKQIRKATGLNQTDFASRIHMKQTSYSQLETGSSPIRESHIDLICNAFNIDRTWFLTGEGEMIARKSESDVDALVKRFSFPEICAKLLYAYDGLDEARQEAVLTYARTFIASMLQDDPASVADAIAAPSQEDAAARQALAQRVREETSPASQPGNEIA